VWKLVLYKKVHNFLEKIGKTSLQFRVLNTITMPRISLLACLLAILSQTSHAFVINMPSLKNAAAVASIAAAIASAPLIAIAESPIDGSYLDPKRPSCERVIQKTGKGGLLLRGFDGTPGCAPDGTGPKTWTTSGRISGNKLVVDFSQISKGPSARKGVFLGVERPRIEWEDGNTWTKN
jgi:hypothetical protein